MPRFIADAHHVGVSEQERIGMINHFASSPDSGDEIIGSGGLRKTRFAGKNKGKSGGYRVMSLYFRPDTPVFLISMLSKSDRGNFSKAEIEAFAKVTAAIKSKLRKTP